MTIRLLSKFKSTDEVTDELAKATKLLADSQDKAKKPVRKVRLLASAHVASEILGNVAHAANTPVRWTVSRYRKERWQVLQHNAEVIVQDCPNCSDAVRKYFNMTTISDFCEDHKPLYVYTKR